MDLGRGVERWVGIGDVAQHLVVSKSWVNKAVRGTSIPVHRVGRQLRFRLSEIDRWIEEQ